MCNIIAFSEIDEHSYTLLKNGEVYLVSAVSNDLNDAYVDCVIFQDGKFYSDIDQKMEIDYIPTHFAAIEIYYK